METKHAKGAYAAYARDLRRAPVLDPDDEHVIALRYSRTRDPADAARLVSANLRIVVWLVRSIPGARDHFDDLVQEGNLGLLHAVRKYDPHRGVKLSSYAAWWIRAYVLRWFIDNARLVKLGTNATERLLFFKLPRARRKLEQLGVTTDPAALARVLGVAERDVVSMERRLREHDVSLDAPLAQGEGTSARSIVERLESLADARPDAICERDDLHERLRDALDRFASGLGERDRVILRDRLLRETPRTLKEIGSNWGVSRERVRQIESRLVARCHAFLRREIAPEGDAIVSMAA